MEKRAYKSPTIREMSGEEIKQKLDAMDLGELVVEPAIHRFSIAHFLTESERKNEALWTKVFRGGMDAILATRTLISQWEMQTLPTEPPTVRTVYVGERSVRWVLCTKDQRWWVTKAGAAKFAAEDAIRFESEMKAEEARSAYMKFSPDGPQFFVREVVV
jgi:hypothetical protein